LRERQKGPIAGRWSDAPAVAPTARHDETSYGLRLRSAQGRVDDRQGLRARHEPHLGHTPIMRYALVSDIDADELRELAARITRAP
jgi:hypothetical protein